MQNVKNYFLFVIVGIVISSMAQLVLVPLVYFYLSNQYLGTLGSRNLGMVAFNIPVFILFFILFLLLGKIRRASHIGFWMIIGIWLLVKAFTSECHAEEFVAFVKNCLVVDVLVVGFSWFGFRLSRNSSANQASGNSSID